MRSFKHHLHLFILAALVGILAVGAQADLTHDSTIYGAYDGSGDVWDDSNWGEFPSEPWSGEFQVGVKVNLSHVDDELVGCTVDQYVYVNSSWDLVGTYSASASDIIDRHNNGTPSDTSDDWGFCVIDIPDACDSDYEHTEKGYKLEFYATGFGSVPPGGIGGGGKDLMLMLQGYTLSDEWEKLYDGRNITVDFPRAFTGGNQYDGPFMWADDGDSLSVSVATIDGSEVPYPPGTNAASWVYCQTGAVYLEAYTDADSKTRWRPAVDSLEGAVSGSYSDPDEDAPTTRTWNYTLNYPSSDHYGYIGFDGVSAADFHELGSGGMDNYYSSASWTPVNCDFDVQYEWFGLRGPEKYYNQWMTVSGPSTLCNFRIIRYSRPYNAWESVDGTASYSNGTWTITIEDFADAGDGEFDNHQAATLYAISAQDGDSNCDDPNGRWMKPLGCVFNCHGGQPNVGGWNEERLMWASFTVN